MRKKKILICISLVLLLVWFSSVSANEALYLRLKWMPGEIYKYSIKMKNEVNVEGEKDNCLRMEIKDNISYQVLDKEFGDSEQNRKKVWPDKDASASLFLGDQLFEVEPLYDDFTVVFNESGTEFKVIIGKEKIKAWIDGKLLSRNELKQIKREVKPLQDLMNAPVRLTMSDSGRIMKVSGMEGLDAELQQDFALTVLEGMILPEKPIRIGDYFTETKNLENLFPKQPSFVGKTINIKWTFEGVDETNGNHIARLVGTVDQRFKNIQIDDDSEGNIEVNLEAIRLHDIEAGRLNYEECKGKIKFFPNKSSGIKDVIISNFSNITRLIEMQLTEKRALK